MLRLADTGWRELEFQTKTKLRAPTGGIFIGPKSTGVVAGSLETARFGGIQHEHLMAEELSIRFPQFAVKSDMEAVFEPGAYPLLAEESRLQMLNEAVRNGACLMYGTHVSEIITSQKIPTIKTMNGETISAGTVIVCAGAWAGDMLPELKAVANPHWVPIHWFQPRPGRDFLFNEKIFQSFFLKIYKDHFFTVFLRVYLQK